MKRRYRLRDAVAMYGALCGLGLGIHGCGEAQALEPSPEVAVNVEALDLAKECGFVCPGDTDVEGKKVLGIKDGRASISGVADVDAFFASVINFQAAAKGVSAGIDAELAAIKADFGLPDGDIGLQLKTKLDASLEAGWGVKVTPARCKADVKAEIDAAARCDATVKPGMVKLECSGGCEAALEAKVDCRGEADLKCTVKAPEYKCMGECNGSCTVTGDAALNCSGECTGECMGTCSVYGKDGKCAGSCSGMCKGSCTAQATAQVNCGGKCSGECVETRKPEAGCMGGIRASCEAKANAKIQCDTKCSGEFEPPEVKAECKARVHADAKLNVQCTPPKVEFAYKVKADLKGEARVRFDAAFNSLIKVRLPALKAAVARSSLVTSAGGDLSGAAGVALKGAVDAARTKSGVDIKVAFGLGCALEELKAVGDIVTTANNTVKASVDNAAKITGQLKI